VQLLETGMSLKHVALYSNNASTKNRQYFSLIEPMGQSSTA
jgi:hypothetical protein